MTIGVLFVCTGNICRSPMAVGVFRTLVRKAGLDGLFTVESAGTSDSHVGEPASQLAIEAAARRGYDIAEHRARLLTGEDLERFEHSIALDRSHLAAMRWMGPRRLESRPRLLLSYAPQLNILDVADPYGGTATNYARALDLIEAGCRGLFEELAPLAKIEVSSPRTAT